MTRLLTGLARPARPRRRPNYREVGATRTPDALPEGHHHLRHSTVVGHGQAAFETAGAAVTTWAMHRATGARVRADARRAAPGVAVEVSLGLGPLRLTAPCAVIWTAYEERRTGFAYGTLTGHPERGEESFVVERDEDGTVRFTVTAFSRPAVWYTRLAGPLVPVLQRAYARRLGRTLARLVARDRRTAPIPRSGRYWKGWSGSPRRTCGSAGSSSSGAWPCCTAWRSCRPPSSSGR